MQRARGEVFSSHAFGAIGGVIRDCKDARFPPRLHATLEDDTPSTKRGMTCKP